MKIAYLLTRSDSVGGASVHVIDMALSLQQAGHQVFVLVGGSGPVAERLDADGIPWQSIPSLRRPVHPWHDLLALILIIRRLHQFRPDVLACHTSKAGGLGRLAARILHIPCIYTPHCWSFVDGFRGAGFYLFIEKLLMPLTSAVVAVSEWEKEIAEYKGFGSLDKIHVIHNGIADTDNRQADPAKHPPRLVSVARFEAQKDHETLLRALARCTSLPWELDLIGDGPDQGQIQDLVAELGLESQVSFLGACCDIPDRLPDYQGFILSSHWESFPRSILEAMCAGLPVVATDVGGVREAVLDGRTGKLVERKNISGMVEALQVLLSEPETRAQWGQAGRGEFESRWRLDTMVQSTLNLYQTVCREREV